MARYLQQLGVRLAHRSRRFVAVDFDSRRLRVVSARRAGGRAEFLKCHSVEIPSDVAVNDPASFGPFLHKSLKKLRAAGYPVLMAVPRSQAVLKPLTLPAGTDDDEVASMVRFQVEKELPFRVEDAVVDHTLGGGHYGSDGGATAEGVHVLVAAIRLPTVDFYRRLAEAGSFRLLRLGLRPSATADCVRACREVVADEGVAVIHVGFDEIEISVLHGGSLSFTRSVSVKNGAPPAAAAPIPLASPGKPADAGTGPIPLAPIAPATNGTTTNGTTSNGNGTPAVSPTGPTVASAAPEIARTLQSYQALQRQGRIATVLVAGETGIEEALVGELSLRLRMPCQQLSADELAGSKKAPPTGAMASPLGLALAHAASEFDFDFLSPRRPVVRRDAKKVKSVAALVAAAMIVTGLLAANYMYLDDIESRVDAAHRDMEKLKKIDDELSTIAKKANTLQEWERGRQDWLAHWANLSDLLPDAQSAYLKEIKIEPATNVPSRLKGKDDEPVATIKFTLRARDQKIITDLTAKLQDDGEYRLMPSRIEPCKDEYIIYKDEMVFTLTVPRSMVDLFDDLLPLEEERLYRPEDDDSAMQFGRRAVVMPTREPIRASNNAGGEAARPAITYREISFNNIRRGEELLTQLSATPLRITGRLVADPKAGFLVPSASAETHVAYRLEEIAARQGGNQGGNPGGRGGNRGGGPGGNTAAPPQGTGRFVYVYVAKNSPAASEIQRRGDRGLRMPLRVDGLAYFTGDLPKDCPVGLLAEAIR
ncbi:MAG: pilus assembly protein PilM [Phycisphaerae bacterium]|nr:pilus assembly protein PilM [Phycisphaerae bacterium]